MTLNPTPTMVSELQNLDNSLQSPPKRRKRSVDEMALLSQSGRPSISKMKDKLISKDVKALFKTENQSRNTINSLKKEVKVNDTIVAIISFVIMILCFLQLDNLISANYQMTDIILTIRTAIIILSIPNSTTNF